MFDLLGGHGKVTQILEPRKAFAGSKPTSNFLPCGSRLPLTTKRRPTIALLSKLRRPLNVIHSNDRFTKFNRARGNSDSCTAAISILTVHCWGIRQRVREAGVAKD